jgi:hypothetical protein
VTALARGDAERLLRFVADAEELGGDEPFAPSVLEELGKLVRADWVTYCEQDRVRQRIRYEARRGDERRDVSVTYWDIAPQHPVCAYHNRGDARARRDPLGAGWERRVRLAARSPAHARVLR